MRRKPDSTLSLSLPPSKQAKIEESPLNPLLGILQPLIDNGKLRINGRKSPNYNSNEIYQKFHNHYTNQLLSETEKELGRFIPSQLANLENREDKNGTLEYLNLLKRPYKDEQGTRMDYYDSNNQTIKMSPYDTKDNPIVTLMHEGTHALDDLFMRTYQKEAIDSLAKMESKGKTPLADGSWYDQAQNILNSDIFKEHYSYKSENAKQNIQDSFSNLAKDNSSDEYKPTEITNFKQAQEALKNLNSETSSPDPSYFFASLSEFPAFAVENISKPWEINANNWLAQNDGRKFLKSITKGVYNNFSRLEPKFNEQYPNANQSFTDRISQLRNYAKHPTPAEYLEHFRQKYNNYQEPVLQQIPLNSSSSSSSSYNPIIPSITDID